MRRRLSGHLLSFIFSKSLSRSHEKGFLFPCVDSCTIAFNQNQTRTSFSSSSFPKKFSAVPNRPLRGERRRDGRSEDRLLRKFDAEDDLDMRSAYKNSSSQFNGRPRRGERMVESSEDRFLPQLGLSDDDGDIEGKNRAPQNDRSQFVRRPLRGERGGEATSEHRFTGNFDLGDDRDEDSARTSRRNLSSQFLRRPMRGDKREVISRDFNHRKFDSCEEGDGKVEKPRKPLPDLSSILQEETPSEQKEGISSEDLSDGKLFKLGEDFEDGDLKKGEGNLQSKMQNRSIGRDEKTDSCSDLLYKQSGDVASGGEVKKSHQNPSIKIPKAEADALESTPQDADEIFRKMRETGLIPNAVAMLDGLCKDGLIQEAMKLFGLMRETGTIPEVVIYTAVVEGFCKAAKFDDAKRIFRKMQKNGISPNAFSYGVLIQGLCKGKKSEDSLSFCFEMLEAGHSPNVTTFVNLMDLLCREKGMEEATDTLCSLRGKGLALDDKAVREHLDKKGPFSPSLWEVIFGKKRPHMLF